MGGKRNTNISQQVTYVTNRKKGKKWGRHLALSF